MAAIINTEVDTGERCIPVRIYRPALTGEPKVVVFIHGGGHLSGSVEVYDPVARHLAMATGNIVVSVDYRLAPENPYPAGLSDAKAVIENVWSLLDSQHIPYTRQLTLIGDSGGGAFSTTLAAYFSRAARIYSSPGADLSEPGLHAELAIGAGERYRKATG
ncbi:alpha/beta hydrolase [Citrobacter sp. Cpo126]|nr:alpha/beta hydrolase [Citrobacter sp. Cpo126]MDM2772232.1 alpha/beta hydrolase [Citrobacter sp. Cpo126]